MQRWSGRRAWTPFVCSRCRGKMLGGSGAVANHGSRRRMMGMGFSSASARGLASVSGSETQREGLQEVVRQARNRFGETLPRGFLSEEEFGVYKRLYGEPVRITMEEVVDEEVEGEGEGEREDVLLREGRGGVLEEVDLDVDIVDEYVEDEEFIEAEGEDGEVGTETLLTFGDVPEQAPLAHRTKDEILEEIVENWPGDEYIRSHPLTLSGRFGTKPSTLQLPRATFVEPVKQMLAHLPAKHLVDAAHKALGGVGIPDSPSTPAIGRSKGQRPVPLMAMQARMAPIEADVYLAGVMPQVYASVVSVLVECRKRMGGAWLRKLLRKEGGPVILDAGAGGTGVIAWREILRAEWESMSEEESGVGGGLGEEVPVGRSTVVTGSDSLRHRASTLLENTTFIPRVPDFVDPTEVENVQQPRKRYDVIIAPHTLWPLTEEHEKRARVQTLWSLLNPDGGLLILIEKGVPRGFEAVAEARKLLLNKHISSPGDERYVNEQDTGSTSNKKERFTEKEKGCIIAPCTNHKQCPMYPIPGLSRGRKDWCYFTQRYTRPSYLMTVLAAKSRNHDDVEFSYLAVQRGVDQRSPEGDSLLGRGFIQGAEATKEALEGFGPALKKKGDEDTGERQQAIVEHLGLDASKESVFEDTEVADPHPLTLPRVILKPLKRKGHVLLDVCTPAGTYERWMVTRREGKQVFRDARKASWGDLWAMGARGAEDRRVNLGTPVRVAEMAAVGGGKGGGKNGKGGKVKKELRRRGRERGKAKVRFDGGDVKEGDDDGEVEGPIRIRAGKM